jgi:hypothetical protein
VIHEFLYLFYLLLCLSASVSVCVWTRRCLLSFFIYASFGSVRFVFLFFFRAETKVRFVLCSNPEFGTSLSFEFQTANTLTEVVSLLQGACNSHSLVVVLSLRKLTYAFMTD